MNLIKRDWIAFAGMLAPIIYLALIYGSLPQTVPTHWDFKGQIDGWSDKSILWLMPLLFPGLMYIIFPAVAKIDPKRKVKENTSVRRLKILLTVLMSAFCCYIIYCVRVKELRFPPFLFIGLIFVVIGNYMYSIKPNYFIGIRTPWTLESEEVWRKTHRMAAPVWVVAGIFLCIASLLLPQKIMSTVCTIITLIAAFIPVIYSYNIWKKLK